MEQFQHEITFLGKIFNPELNGGVGAWEFAECTKIATFKELSRTDRDQHKLHFKIVGMFTNSIKDSVEEGKENGLPELNPEALCDLTCKIIKDLLIPTEGFTMTDREELLGDSGALIMLGMWLLGNKIAPFFSVLMKNYKK